MDWRDRAKCGKSMAVWVHSHEIPIKCGQVFLNNNGFVEMAQCEVCRLADRRRQVRVEVDETGKRGRLVGGLIGMGF